MEVSSKIQANSSSSDIEACYHVCKGKDSSKNYNCKIY